MDIRVNRNHFGRQIESFQTDLDLPFLESLPENIRLSAVKFPGIFIRAPIVERVLPNVEGIQTSEQEKLGSVVAPSRAVIDGVAKKALENEVKVMATLPGRVNQLKGQGKDLEFNEEAGNIIAVKQGNVFGTSFHPELSDDARIHVWWLLEVQNQLLRGQKAPRTNADQLPVSDT